MWKEYRRDGGDGMLREHGITTAESILDRASQLSYLQGNLWEKEKEEMAQRRAALLLEEKRRFESLLADDSIPARMHRFLHALFSLPPKRFESSRTLRTCLEEGREQPYHELDREGPPLRYIWSSLRAYELRGRGAATDEKLFHSCWEVRQGDDNERREAAAWITSFQRRMSIQVDEIVYHPYMDLFLETFGEVADIFRFVPLSFATIYNQLNKRSEGCNRDFRQRVLDVFGTYPFKEGRARRSAPRTDFQVAFSHSTRAYLLYADEELAQTWSDDQMTDCFEGLTKLQALLEKQQNKVARSTVANRMADVGEAASESDSSHSSRGGCVVRNFDGPAFIGGGDRVDASDDDGASEQDADSDSESQATSASEVVQYDPEEFHIRPRLPDLPDAAKRVPPQVLTKMFEALKMPDEYPQTAESARRSLCRVIKHMPAGMAQAFGISAARVQEMDPRFVFVLHTKIYCKLIDMSLYNRFYRQRRGGGGHRA